MAKVSAHGQTVGTIYLTTSAKRYMSDGVVLRNHGSGWKLYGRVRGATPEQAYQRQVQRLNDYLDAHPEEARYRALLHGMTGLSKRWKLHAAVTLMPNDYDGVWSEACDGYGDNVSASIDEIGELCRAYQAAEAAREKQNKENAS